MFKSTARRLLALRHHHRGGLWSKQAVPSIQGVLADVWSTSGGHGLRSLPILTKGVLEEQGRIEVSAAQTTALSGLGATEVAPITTDAFVPATVTIGINHTVRWVNTDAVTHTVVGGLPYQRVHLPLVMKLAPLLAAVKRQP